MKSSKLIKIFRTLSKDEFKRLSWFVNSDYFNTDRNIIKFYNYLKKNYPDFSSKKLTKDNAFDEVFNGTKYNDAKMRNLMSKMREMLESYLITLEWENNLILREQLLIKAFENRNIDQKECQKKNHNLIGTLEKKKMKDTRDYSLLFSLNANYYFNPNTDKTGDAIKNLKKADNHLDVFYQIAKLKLLCEFNARRGIINEGELRVRTDTHLEKSTSQKMQSPLGKIYSDIFELQNFPTFEKYKITKSTFETYFEHVDPSEQRETFQLLLNFAIGQHNQGIKEYTEEVFSLYQYGLENEILFNGNIISDATYLGIVTQGSRLGKFEWIKFFIENYKKFLKSDKTKETISLGWGYWYFFQTDHTSTIDFLQKISFVSLEYKIHSKLLLIRSYYELFSKDDSYFQLTHSCILAFEKFLKRNRKLPQNKKKMSLNFTAEIRKLIKIKYEKKTNKELKGNWLYEINKRKNLIAKSWLIEKINEL